MLWEDFLLSTVRPYPADWMIVGGWGCLNYLVRLDEDCVPFLVLGQNGGLQVEGDDEADDEYDDGGSEGVYADALGEGLPETGGPLWKDGECGRLRPRGGPDEDVLGRIGRMRNLRRINLPVRWRP